MKALAYDRFGEPTEVIALKDVAAPEPGANEVRVQMLLSPIHNHDLATIRGIYGVKPALPAIGGSEMVGLVDGRRVATMPRGAWAEYAIAHVDGLVPVPDGIPDEIACQLLAMPLSAIVLFDELHVSKGDWIVQNAANGAVARTLITLAQKAGVNIVNLVRREAAAEEMRAHGAQHVLVQEGDWLKRIREISGGAPIARFVDSVCDDNSLALNALLGAGGEHVVFGALAKRALCVNPGALIYAQSTIRGFWMIAWMTKASMEQKRDVIGRCLGMALAGDLTLPVAATYPLEKGADALKEAETPGRPGKVLLSP